MKKEEWIIYGVTWIVVLAGCVSFLFSIGFTRLTAAKTIQKSAVIEDEFLGEQLLLENEKQIQKKQDEEQELQNEALEEVQRQTEHAITKAAEEQKIKETQEVFSAEAARIQETGSFLSDCFIIDPNTTLTEQDVSLENLISCDLSMTSDASEPQILIYHTHATEGYIDSKDGDPSTTVVGVGDYLQELLTVRYGYHVLHDTETYDLAEGTLDRSRAYNYARTGLQTILETHPSIQVIIDLHRDGVADDKHLVTEIDGKQTAQIMFFNGLSHTIEKGTLNSLPNPYIQENLAFSLQLELLGNHYYSDYIRGIYVKGYRYNLHFRPRSLLLEVGAQTNTLEEAMNAMEPFAEILDKLLKGT